MRYKFRKLRHRDVTPGMTVLVKYPDGSSAISQGGYASHDPESYVLWEIQGFDFPEPPPEPKIGEVWEVYGKNASRTFFREFRGWDHVTRSTGSGRVPSEEPRRLTFIRRWVPAD